MNDMASGQEQSETQGVQRHRSACLIALQFLTTLPIRSVRDYSKPTIGLSLLYYPLTGVLLGAALVILATLGQGLFSAELNAALLLLCWVGFTGALHLDGLGDCADAWIGGLGDRERTLRLMKDPTSGPVAITVLVLVLLLKWALLRELLLADSFGAAALVLAPLLGRMTPLLLFLTTPYIRKAGLGEVLVNHFPRSAAKWQLLLIASGIFVVGTLFYSVAVFFVLLAALMAVIGLRQLMLKRLGGCTGDTIGAAIELLEVVVLFAMVTVAALVASGSAS